MDRPTYAGASQKVLAGVAVAFGIVTLVVGSRVLSGFDPGYVVFRPLLVYNTVMGLAYVGVGVLAWRSLDRGRQGAAAIFLLNLGVLVAIGVLYASGAAVAIDSLRAMTFRTLVWLLLFAGLRWLSRREHGAETPAGR